MSDLYMRAVGKKLANDLPYIYGLLVLLLIVNVAEFILFCVLFMKLMGAT